MKTRSRSKPGSPDPAAREAAAELAVAALAYIATEPDALARFLGLTGIDPSAIRNAAHEPGFLLGVLDYLAGDEELLLAFADRNEIDPEAVARAQIALAGDKRERS